MSKPKIPIVEKAYNLVMSRIDEGYLWDIFVCHAEDLNQAKTKLLDEIKYEGMKLNRNGNDITYLNIPVVRCKTHDKVIFEGKEVMYFEIDGLIADRERMATLDEIANNPDIQYCYIIKGSYYRPNSCGYTCLKFEAGVYQKDEAISHAKSVREIRLERVDIDEHNKMITEKIKELESRLLLIF